MKATKTIISVLLAALMLFSLASCKAGSMDAEGNFYAPSADATGAADIIYAAQAAEKTGSDFNQQQDLYKLIENEFISTADNAVSTFSADVDTASYTYFRKLVNSGYDLNELISYAGNAIRTEEMINYFTYSYEGPVAGDLFGVNAMIASCPWNEQAVLLRLGLKADAAIKSSGNNLVFLIDVSGSMNSDDKLRLLKTAFSYLTAQLTDNDTISIVTYSGNEKVVLEGCSGSKGEKILKAVNSLTPGGSTNGQAGLQKAYEIAQEYYIEGGNNRIIMASDGDLNVGISSPEELKNFVTEKRDAGVYLSVLGFGTGNYRDSNMEALADNGNGIYYYIDGSAEAEKVFGTDLLGTLYTVAEDVKLQLTFDPESVASYRLVGYENRLLNKEDFTDDTKDAGEVGAGHTVTVCYELKLTDSAMNASNPWMKLAIRYKNPGETVSKLNEYNIGTAEYTNTPDNDFKFVCAVAEVSMVLHQSNYFNKISEALDLVNSLELSDDQYMSEFCDIVRKIAK